MKRAENIIVAFALLIHFVLITALIAQDSWARFLTQ